MKMSLKSQMIFFLEKTDKKLLPLFQWWFKEHLKNLIFPSLVEERKPYFSLKNNGKIQMICA